MTDSTTAQLWMEDNGIRPVAASPSAQACIWDVDLTGPTALVVGSEDQGLTEEWLNQDILAVSLPMKGVSDSLNVSVAAAVLLFEAARQRR
ncbi:MAG: hypothetical protein LR015_02255 [Verrucomicrobia bacterium]|nr:hypothetical protein [Verrucomicrobiota bacterium]